MTAARQRVDWVTFFRQFARPHGIRLRLPKVDQAAPVGVTAEKRLLNLIRARSDGEPFALRRSFNPGPMVIDCVFSSESLADRLALEIGAKPFKAPLGWATGRELVADDASLRRLLKLGDRPRSYILSGEPRTEVSALSIPPRVAKSDPVQEALQRLGALSIEEQAAALFETMTRSTASADDRNR